VLTGAGASQLYISLGDTGADGCDRRRAHSHKPLVLADLGGDLRRLMAVRRHAALSVPPLTGRRTKPAKALRPDCSCRSDAFEANRRSACLSPLGSLLYSPALRRVQL